MVRVVGLEIAVAGLMKVDQQRHDLARAQLGSPLAGPFAAAEQLCFPDGKKGLTEIIDMTEQFD